MRFPTHGFEYAGQVPKGGIVATILLAALLLAPPAAHAQTLVPLQTLAAPATGAPALPDAGDADVTEPSADPSGSEEPAWFHLDDGTSGTPNDGKGGPLYGHSVVVTDYFASLTTEKHDGSGGSRSSLTGRSVSSNAVVPEPSTLPLLSIVMPLVGITLRRRRTTSK